MRDINPDMNAVSHSAYTVQPGAGRKAVSLVNEELRWRRSQRHDHIK